MDLDGGVVRPVREPRQAGEWAAAGRSCSGAGSDQLLKQSVLDAERCREWDLRKKKVNQSVQPWDRRKRLLREHNRIALRGLKLQHQGQ